MPLEHDRIIAYTSNVASCFSGSADQQCFYNEKPRNILLPAVFAMEQGQISILYCGAICFMNRENVLQELMRFSQQLNAGAKR